jgi:XTP/dITP diphosphohydrolase
MRKIIFATNNKHKLREIRQITGNLINVSGLGDIGFEGDIPETGATLKENASIKSNFIFDRFHMDCFADDTGLEIEALDGRPGIFSARYAGGEGNAEKNIEKVLAELNGIKNRKARFITIISLIFGGKEHFFEGSIKGKIIDSKHGKGGFGYDPVFIPDRYYMTFAEMRPALKNKISHRAIATKKLIEFLMKQ